MNGLEIDSNALKYIFGEQKILFEKGENSSLITSNDAQTVVVMNHLIDSTQREFVQNILKACKITDNIIYIDALPAHVKDIRNHCPQLKQIMLFGVTYKEIGIDMMQQPIDVIQLNGVYVFATPEIQTLSGQVQMKNYFWQKILKPIYGS